MGLFARGRLLFRAYRRGCSPLVTLKYAYNQLGQRILDDRSMPNGNQIARFTYNQRLELVKSVRDRGGCGPNEVHTYAYDLNHNWTQKDGVSYTHNIADQLLAVAGGGSLSYNDSGQATDVQGWDVTYNCADQITSILAPGKNIAYRYDGSGQRIEKTVNGVTQKFLWNGGDICKEYRADGTVRADYFLGAGREGIKTNGQWHWYLSDIQGSTLMLTDATGHSAATYDYSDYGETRQTSGSPALYNPFLYTGQEYDFETSLYHLRARHYSPANGRFFSRDPIGYAGGSNMYAYCAGDPVDFSDPSGLGRIWIGQGRDLRGNLSFETSGHIDNDVYLNELKRAYESTTGLLLLFGHNYAGGEGFHLASGNYRLEGLTSLTRSAKIVAIIGCRSDANYGKAPLGEGQGTLTLKFVSDIFDFQYYIKPFVQYLESGETLQVAHEKAIGHVFGQEARNRIWNTVRIQGGNARL